MAGAACSVCVCVYIYIYICMYILCYVYINSECCLISQGYTARIFLDRQILKLTEGKSQNLEQIW
jgi:hypothetical protein